MNSSRNDKITLPFTDVGNHALVAIFNVANMSFNAIHENKILAKISEFTVTVTQTPSKHIKVGQRNAVQADGCSRMYASCNYVSKTLIKLGGCIGWRMPL